MFASCRALHLAAAEPQQHGALRMGDAASAVPTPRCALCMSAVVKRDWPGSWWGCCVLKVTFTGTGGWHIYAAGTSQDRLHIRHTACTMGHGCWHCWLIPPTTQAPSRASKSGHCGCLSAVSPMYHAPMCMRAAAGGWGYLVALGDSCFDQECARVTNNRRAGVTDQCQSLQQGGLLPVSPGSPPTLHDANGCRQARP
jgi:hypothetical protein